MNIKQFNLDGENCYRLENEYLDVILTSTGAGIYSLKFLNRPMTIVPKEMKEYLISDGYYGKSIGRIAGRLRDGILSYKGKDYQISQNEGKKSLHGGINGFSHRVFSSRIENDFVVFSLDSENGDNGYPGKLHLEVSYTLRDNSLFVIFTSVSDSDTPVNFTNHSYFSLDEDSCKDLTLYLASSKAMDYDDALIPTGLVDNNETMDFLKPKKIGQDIDNPYLYKTPTKGYDHYFLLDKKVENQADIILESKNIKMEIGTTFPGAQIYTGNYYPENLTNNRDKKFVQNHSVAIEPEYCPFDYDSMTSYANKKKENVIRYTFNKK